MLGPRVVKVSAYCEGKLFGAACFRGRGQLSDAERFSLAECKDKSLKFYYTLAVALVVDSSHGQRSVVGVVGVVMLPVVLIADFISIFRSSYRRPWSV